MSNFGQFNLPTELTPRVLVVTVALALAILATWLACQQVWRTRCKSVMVTDPVPETIPACRVLNYHDVEGQVRSGSTPDLVEEGPTEPMAPCFPCAEANCLTIRTTGVLAVFPLPRDRTPFRIERTVAPALRDGDVVLVEAGERIPADGRILEGVATVDESVVSGVSDRAFRGEGTNCCEVLAGSGVVEGRILVQVQDVDNEVLQWLAWPEADRPAGLLGDEPDLSSPTACRPIRTPASASCAGLAITIRSAIDPLG